MMGGVIEIPSAREIGDFVGVLCYQANGTGFNYTRSEVLAMTIGEAQEEIARLNEFRHQQRVAESNARGGR